MSQIEIYHVMIGGGAILIIVCGFITHCISPCWCMCCCRECVRKKTDDCCKRGKRNDCCNRGKRGNDCCDKKKTDCDSDIEELSLDKSLN